MSVERSCRTCGCPEGIRLNFGCNTAPEKKYHREDFYCDECKANEMDDLARELDLRYSREEMRNNLK